MTSQRGLTVTETANSNLQNQINISIIFNYVRSHGVAYRAQIARDLGISAPAVSRVVDKLVRAGDLVESERVQVENGKKAAQLSVNADRGIIVGVDILTDPIEISISDFAGTVLHSQKGPPFDEGSDLGEFLLGAIGDALSAFRAAGRRARRILAIGIGVPAVVDPKSGRILSASLYGNLVDAEFREKLRARHHAPVFVENISNLAAIGEWKRGVGRGSRNMVFLELSNGIGAGVILEGELYRGALGSAGEVGFSVTHPDGLGHGSSHKGYLESVASLGALRERSRARYGEAPRGQDPIRALCDAAAAGDAWARSVLGEAMRHLAVAAVNTLVLLNPELLVIGGGICDIPSAVSMIAQPLIQEIRRYYPFQPPQILLTSLGARASVFGALQYALDSLIVRSYPYRFEIAARSHP